MGFLDNLENTLKNAERGSEREDERAATVSRAEEMAALRASAPHAETLKKSQWTQDLLTQCVTLGHGQRTRVGMAWVGTTLRLDAKEKRMDLRPTSEGVEAVYSVDGVEIEREPIDMAGDPAVLARKWLGVP
ncbi:MAG TPA: hypothetical protein VFQ91_08505 [Bryobacteraceae bacterium]|nr:hypothetical protein [Bryobacteraceae bacterium]